jgi:regulator of protease activity HflC (stomatin/prohibitin superfamily)
MERNIQRKGLTNLLLLLGVAVVATVFARLSSSNADEVATIFLWLGFLVSAMSYFQMRLEAREALEKLEMEELARLAHRTSLFETADAESFPARRARVQFEKWIVPLFTVVLFLMQGSAAWFMWKRALNPPVAEGHANLPALAAIFIGCFVVLFIAGRFAVNFARFEDQRLLRPSGSYLLLGAYLTVISASSIALVHFHHDKFDVIIARVLCAILTLAAAETLINLILEIYRPRVSGKAGRLLYDSRLVGLLGQPEGLFTTAAQAIDYQFGFKVSETWFYKFLERSLSWLILVQVGVLLLSTCVVYVEPHEEALLERFGKPVEGREVLKPGLALTLPWPIDRAYRFQTRQIQTFNIGYVPDPDKEREKVVVWTTSHAKEEYNLIVASREREASTNAAATAAVPVNLLTVSIPVQFRIKDIVAWARQHTDGGALLEKLASREVNRYLVSVDLLEIMSTGRERAARELRERMQKLADDRNLGVEITYVGLRDIHPPIGGEMSKVAEAFESVIGAEQEKAAKILHAEGAANRTNALASAEAVRVREEADAFKLRRTATAQASGAQFADQVKAFAAAPVVYPERYYLETVTRAMTGQRKFIVAVTNASEVIQLDLHTKIRSDLLDVPVPPGKK